MRSRDLLIELLSPGSVRARRGPLARPTLAAEPARPCPEPVARVILAPLTR